MGLFKRSEKNGVCCFTGHRVIPISDRERIKSALEKAVENMIVEKGVSLFIVGGALGFDTSAALVVLSAKKRHFHIKLRVAVPCDNQTRGWSEKAVALYEDILGKADEIVQTGREYTSGCMHVRNRYMVDCSDYCIAYKTRESGGTAYTVRYALEKGVEVINLA